MCLKTNYIVWLIYYKETIFNNSKKQNEKSERITHFSFKNNVIYHMKLKTQQNKCFLKIVIQFV